MIQFFGRPLHHMVYIFFIIVVAGYFPLRLVLSCAAAILVLGIPTIILDVFGGFVYGEDTLPGYVVLDHEFQRWFYILLVATGIFSGYFFHRETRKTRKAVQDLQDLKSSAINLEASTESSAFDEDRYSHLVKSILETQRELATFLELAKKIHLADSVFLFTPEKDNLVLRASTEEVNTELSEAEKLYLSGIMKTQKIIVQRRPGGASGLRSIRPKEAKSFLSAPVLDGSIPLGVLAMFSDSESLLDERGKDVAGEFAAQAGMVLKRSRISMEIERFTKGFKALHEASKTLSTHLEVEKIAEGFVDLVSGMVSSSAIGFFMFDKGQLKVIAKKGFEPEKKAFYAKGTFFKMIIKNKQTLHFSHLEKKKDVFPFKAADTRTFLGIPIMSENEVIGVFAITSREPDAISSFHSYLLTTIADQAGMSITNAQLHNQVEMLAITDGLTGLYNHKHFQERMNDEFQRLQRIPQPLTMMLMDIDFFKKINDTYGHPAGDMVLRKLAQMLRKALRGIDIIARYGGEEFATVLVGAEVNGARKMAERLRTTVMNTSFPIDQGSINITLSIGLAAFPHDAGTKEEIISRADQALYYAKENGRNRVCTWKEITKKRKAEDT
jgi:diguanylate cyclase (GGDEF)-like protein